MRDKSGDYTLLEKIGRGGMGQVWTGVRRDLVAPCAIKVLHPELAETEKDRERFFNEARIAAQLDHGRIVKVIDTGELQGRPFLVMDWVDGLNLRELVTKAREARLERLDLSLSLFIVGEILAALQYAHNRTVGGHDAGVIHYDVTPGNILISSSGEVKLTDFGIARFASTAGPLSRSVGTPRYMSPEQITGHPLRETDIYSLGVVLYELIEGARYLGGTCPDQFRSRVLLGPPPELSRADIPEWLRRLVRQMLAVRPEQRPSAAAARTVLTDNAIAYPSTSRSLRALYKTLVGEPRSGLTQLLELGEAVHECGVSSSVVEARRRPPPLELSTLANEPRGDFDTDAPLGSRAVMGPAGAGLLGAGASSSTVTGIPQRRATPEPEAELEDELEATVELPMEDMLQAAPSSPLGAEGQQPVSQRWLVVGLGAMVILMGAALAWTTLVRTETVAAPEEQLSDDRPYSRTSTEPEPNTKVVKSEGLEGTEGAGDTEGDTEGGEDTEDTEDTERTTTVKPPPRPAPVRETVVFLATDSKIRELKVGSKVRDVSSGVVKIRLLPRDYSVAWRESAREEWRPCGTLEVKALAGKDYYDVILRSGSLSSKVVIR